MCEALFQSPKVDWTKETTTPAFMEIVLWEMDDKQDE